MNNTHNRNTIWGAGLAVLAVAFAASARSASAQTPLLSNPAQVRQAFDGWGHDNDWNRDGDRGRDSDRDWERIRAERERRMEQERREAERARHEAEVRHAAEVRHEQWLREHRHDGDHDRHDFDGGWQRDIR